MKKTVLSIVTILYMVTLTIAQEGPIKTVEVQPGKPGEIKATPVGTSNTQPQKAVPVNPNAPEILFSTDVMDYGTVEYNGDGLREFKFTNTGKEPLIITRAKGSCGCTVPTWPKEPIMPGKTGSIKVKYATNRPGRFTKTITITSNAKSPTKRLTIKGTVKPKPVEATDQTLPVNKATEGATPTAPR